jgi:hypothetical protein
MTLKQPILSLILLLLAYPCAAINSPLNKGDNLPTLTLPDQYGKPHSLSEARIILFAPDKVAAELAHQVLQHRSKADLAAQGVLFISDISRMPVLVTRLFAMPTLREYPYLVLLGYKTEETAWLPRREDMLTLLFIQAGRVSHIEYANTLGSLTTKLTLTDDINYKI